MLLSDDLKKTCIQPGAALSVYSAVYIGVHKPGVAEGETELAEGVKATKVVSFRVSGRDADCLAVLAKAEGVTRAAYVSSVVRKHVGRKHSDAGRAMRVMPVPSSPTAIPLPQPVPPGGSAMPPGGQFALCRCDSGKAWFNCGRLGKCKLGKAV